MDWIDEVDLKLKRNSEQQQIFYFQGAKGQELNKEKIEEMDEEKRELLLDPCLLKQTGEFLQKEKNPIKRRKAEILEKRIMEAKVEDKELLRLRIEIEDVVNQFKPVIKGEKVSYTERGEELKNPRREKRREAYYALRPLLDSIDLKARSAIKLANKLARKEGFHDYAELALFLEGFSLSYILDVFSRIRKETESIWKKYLEVGKKEICSQDIKEYDLRYIHHKLTSPPDEKFPEEKMLKSLKSTLFSFGITLESLPIKVEYYDIPYGGICYPLKMGKDIRIILNPKDGYRYYFNFFHEFGHAMHFSYLPQDSSLLVDESVFMEGMADIWAGFIEQREWLQEYSLLSDKQINEFIRSRVLSNTYWNRTLMRNFTFEIELYRNPDADFFELYRKTGKEYLGIEDNSCIWTYFIFVYPLYAKNYIFSLLIKDASFHFLRSKFGNIIGNREVLDFLIEKYYKPGNLIPWREKTEMVTGVKI